MDENSKIHSEIDDFLRKIEDLAMCRGMLAEQKINGVLRSIASSDAICDVIKKSMVNFDFIEEWKKSTKGDSLVIPDEPHRQIAFIFSMLNNIDDKNLDLNKVLDHYFSGDKNISAFDLFVSSVVLKFSNLIKTGVLGSSEIDAQKETYTKVNSFDNAQKPDDYEQYEDIGFELTTKTQKAPLQVSNKEMVSNSAGSDEKTAPTDELIDGIVYISGELEKMIKNARHIKILLFSREELLSILSSLISSAKNKERHCFYGLVVAISRALKKAKETYELVSELELIVEELLRRK